MKTLGKNPGLVVRTGSLVLGGLALLGSFTALSQTCELAPRPAHLAPGSVIAVNHFADKLAKLQARGAPQECIDDAASELNAERVLQLMRLRYELKLQIKGR